MTSCEKPCGSSQRVARWPAKSGCSVAPIAADAEARAPRLLAVDAHVELRNVALVARVGLGDAGHGAHRLEHRCGGDLEPRRLRSLHVDLDRLAAAAEDARSGPESSGGRRESGAACCAGPSWIVEQRLRRWLFGLQRDVDVAVVRRAAEAAADRRE